MSSSISKSSLVIGKSHLNFVSLRQDVTPPSDSEIILHHQYWADLQPSIKNSGISALANCANIKINVNLESGGLCISQGPISFTLTADNVEALEAALSSPLFSFDNLTSVHVACELPEEVEELATS